MKGNWKNDIVEAKIYEDLCGRILCTVYPIYEVGELPRVASDGELPEAFKDYDILLKSKRSDKQIKIEVKSHNALRSHSTFPLELTSNGNRSHWRSADHDLFIQYNKRTDCLYIFDSNTLKELANIVESDHPKSIMQFSDSDGAEGCLVGWRYKQGGFLGSIPSVTK